MVKEIRCQQELVLRQACCALFFLIYAIGNVPVSSLEALSKNPPTGTHQASSSNSLLYAQDPLSDPITELLLLLSQDASRDSVPCAVLNEGNENKIRYLTANITGPLILALYHSAGGKGAKETIIRRFGARASWETYPLLRAAISSNELSLQLAAIESGLFCPHPAWKAELDRLWQRDFLHPLLRFTIALSRYYDDPKLALKMLQKVDILTTQMQWMVKEVASTFSPPSILEIEKLIEMEAGLPKNKVYLLLAALWITGHDFSTQRVQRIAMDILDKALDRREFSYPIAATLAPHLLAVYVKNTLIDSKNTQVQSEREHSGSPFSEFTSRSNRSEEITQKLATIFMQMKKDANTRSFYEMWVQVNLLLEGGGATEQNLEDWKNSSASHEIRLPSLLTTYFKQVMQKQGHNQKESDQLDSFIKFLRKVPAYQRAMVLTQAQIDSHDMIYLSKKHRVTLQEMSLEAYEYVFEHWDPYLKHNGFTSGSSGEGQMHLLGGLISSYLTLLLDDSMRIDDVSSLIRVAPKEIFANKKSPIRPSIEETEETQFFEKVNIVADVMKNIPPFSRYYLIKKLPLGKSQDWHIFCQQVGKNLGLNNNLLDSATKEPIHLKHKSHLEERPEVWAQQEVWQNLLLEELPSEMINRCYKHLTPSDQFELLVLMRGKWSESHLPFLLNEIVALRSRQHLPATIKYLVELYDALIAVQINGPVYLGQQK